MIDLTIDRRLKQVAPKLTVGVLTGEVRVTEHDAALWCQLEPLVARFRGLTMDAARREPGIKALRDAYRALGNDPTRYRGSNEALVRRLVQGKDLYRVNTVVDINNLVSLETLCSCGVTDLTHIAPPVVFRPGLPGEDYEGIGRGSISLENLPVFVDVHGPFASTTSDSERVKVMEQTQQLLFLFISFGTSEGVSEALARTSELLAHHAAGTRIETQVVG